jgi:hypothetical protein
MVPLVVSALALLFALILVIAQFTGIFPLRPEEQSSLILILLVFLGTSSLIERYAILQEILDKLEKLDKLETAVKPHKTHKPESITEKQEDKK